jgi:flagellar motor switch protein FliN/FliY
VSTDEALEKLGTKTGEAIADVLRMFCPEGVEIGKAAVIPTGTPPLRAIPVPAVAASVSYSHGVTGGNIFVMTRRGVQRLAAAMMGVDPDSVEESEELSELELSAAAEAMNQMMSAAAAATSALLGEDVAISPPETHFFSTPEEADDAFEQSPHMTSVHFTVAGEPCRLVQLVPNAFIVRMTRALADLEAEALGSGGVASEGGVPVESVRGIPVRVWAELGRTRMPVGAAVSLPPGAVIDLDASPDEPVKLFVNGRCFGSGRLLLIEDEWAVRVEEIATASSPQGHESGGSN